MKQEVKIGGVYRHYKGKNYRIMELARHSESLEWMVVYECLYENPEARIWVRPLVMWLEEVEWEGKKIPRFNYVGDQKGRERF